MVSNDEGVLCGIFEERKLKEKAGVYAETIHLLFYYFLLSFIFWVQMKVV
jgi:hypothetical protein